MDHSSIPGREFRKTNQTLLSTTFGGINPLDPSHEAIEFVVICTFPINAQYGLLQRVLYYCILVFALFVRNHDWLAAGSLVSALTYSAVAAIHALLLVVNYKTITHPHVTYTNDHNPIVTAGTGDLDEAALFSILSTGSLVAIPLLTWSSTLRRLKTRPIVVYWMILVFVGAIACFGRTFRTDSYYTYQEAAIGICNYAPSDPLWEDPSLRGYFWTEYWSRFNCTSQCSNRSPDVFLRHNTPMVPYLQPYDTTKQQGQAPVPQLPWQIIIVFFAQALYATFNGRRNPSQVRNSLFRAVSGQRRYGNNRRPSLIRIVIAATIALGVYLLSLAIFVVTPVIFVWLVFENEYMLLAFPVAAVPADVDQWSPWASAVLVILAALVARYHDHLTATVIRLWICLRETVRLHRNDLHEPLSNTSAMNIPSFNTESPLATKGDYSSCRQGPRRMSSWPHSTMSNASSIFPRMGQHIWRWIMAGYRRIVQELSDLIKWLQDPVKTSTFPTSSADSNASTHSLTNNTPTAADVDTLGPDRLRSENSMGLQPLRKNKEVLRNDSPILRA